MRPLSHRLIAWLIAGGAAGAIGLCVWLWRDGRATGAGEVAAKIETEKAHGAAAVNGAAAETAKGVAKATSDFVQRRQTIDRETDNAIAKVRANLGAGALVDPVLGRDTVCAVLRLRAQGGETAAAGLVQACDRAEPGAS